MDEADIHTLYRITRSLTDEMFALHKEETGKDGFNMTLPVVLGNDMIVTIERGPKAAADIVIMKAMDA